MALISVTVVSGLVAAAVPAIADDSVVDDVNITVPTACTLASVSASSTAHTATINPGTYEDEIGTTTLKALCNDNNGFSIYAAGYTGNVVGDTNSNKLVGASTNQLIPTGIGTIGDSQWAMKLATTTDPTPAYPITIASAPNTAGGADASFSNYHTVPNEYTKVAYRLQGTDVGNTATGSILTTTYAANISSTQAADTYSGKVIYTMVHPNDHAAPVAPLKDTDCPADKVCYAPNADDIDGSMDSISSTKITKSPTAGVQSAGSNSTYTLIAPNYSRNSYGFAGWSPEFDATTATNPTIYGPNQTITTSTTAGAGDTDVSQHGLILYPVWIASAGTMQSDASSVCSNLTAAPATGAVTLASVSALTDERDDNTYAIAKLADGNCWMIENLRLNADDTLSDANKALAQGYGDDTANNRGKFIGLADSEDSNFIGSTSSATDPTNANSLYYVGTQSGTATMNIGQVNYAGFRIPRYNNNNTNRGGTNSASTDLTVSYNANTNSAQWYGYGNYYNWPATIASTAYNGTNNQSTVTTSLCPTGWQLPTGGQTTVNTTATFYLLGKAIMDNTEPDQNASYGYGYYGNSVTNTNGDIATNAFRKFPNNFIYSGYFYTASADSRNSGGGYWSSTASGSYSSYYLGLNSSVLFPGTNSLNKYSGGGIRCLVSS